MLFDADAAIEQTREEKGFGRGRSKRQGHLAEPQGPAQVHRARHVGVRHRAGGQRGEEPAHGQVSLDEAYARVKDDEVWLVGCDIAEYLEASRFNHNPRRPRKLLMHRREVKRFAHRAFEKGLTLVPLEMHFKRGLAKVVLGICRGKQQHDKREAMKKAQAKRDMARQMLRRK